MRRKIFAVGAVVAVLLGAVAVVVALWMASSKIHTTLVVSKQPGVQVAQAVTDDDEVIFDAAWDSGDTGPDPATFGPQAVRYDKDIATCTGSTHVPIDKDGNLAITAGYGGYHCAAWFKLTNDSPDQPWTLTEVAVGPATLANCPALTSIDLDGDTNLDVEGCVSKMLNTYSWTQLPLIGTSWAPGASYWAKVGLHVLDSATSGITHAFDIAFNGPAQTGGPP